MAIQPKRFNWMRSATGWEQFQGWQEKRRALREDFDFARKIARDGFALAWSNQITEATNLAAEAAIDRLQRAAKAKLDKTA